MSPLPTMAASLQASPHLYAAPKSRYSYRPSSGSGGSIHPRNSRHHLFTKALACQRSPEAPLNLRLTQTAPDKLVKERFASISSSRGKETTSVGVPPQPVSPPPSSVGSPLFWIGVGVGLSALFSWVATYLKKYAMQQAFKAMMGQMNTQNSQFNAPPFSSVSPSPFAPRPPSFPAATSPPPVTVDVPVSKVETPRVQTEPPSPVKDEPAVKEEPKKYAFVDISPEETKQKSAFESFEDVTETASAKDAQSATEVSQNGAASKSETGASGAALWTGKAGPGLSVDALEKMMEDPTVQKMVYPHLPEEMRNPETFKWMLQNPQYRQQLEEMLNNMGGSTEWDGRMMDSLKNFDLSSPEVKQQFDQIGLTPEEVISKIMANPDVAMAFQNPRVQQAIMDCSQNPMSIAKYQNDKEVMDVFNKISELFPGVTGP
ncbi:protein TIC 40, chloroplastic [Punica granatum]|uniref:Protein TIC 40, chloroplastic n=2 Tax=Punica granatum TaxID=22663 RepID=A0A6P8DPD8_PUNGR|nr:protein TIC 40, chloroplastic [Punica granatum]